MNQSFNEGTVPHSLKISKIKPIHKKDATDSPAQYRPIALLPTFAKIFETAVSNKLYSFCEKFNIFSENQNGFRKNRSTSLALYKYINEILNIINNKNYAIGILLDMSKAYDRVSHKILLAKLHDIGVRGLAHKWFQSYLSDREQYVQIDFHDPQTRWIKNIKSDKAHLTGSIPQGSVLGSLLFIIYINDLPKIINEHCVLFADDISIVFPVTNENKLNSTLSAILNKVNNWLKYHNLKLNIDKTKIMQYHPQQKRSLSINFIYNNIALECVDTSTLLGLDIDSNIKWKAHIQKICSKLASFTYALLELKKVTDLKTAMSAYYAFADSRLRYGVTLWGNSGSANELFVCQKKCVRILANIKSTDSCRPHFKKLNILTLPSIYILEMSKFIRKHNHLFPNEQPPTDTRPLRPRHKIPVPLSKLQMHSSGPFIMCLKIYNKVPLIIRNEINIDKFMKSLRKYLIQKSFYTLQEFLENRD